MAQTTILDDSPRRAYTVGGTPQAVFAVPFPFFETSDLDVYVGGVLKTIVTDYTVSGTATDDGYSSGTVTLNTAVSSTTVIVERQVPVERTSNFPTGVSTLNIFTLNTQITKLFAILQQLRGSLGRALTLQANDETAAIAMPLKAARAGKVLGFDASGDPIATDGTALGGTVVSSFMSTLLDDVDAAAARTTLGAGTGTANPPKQGADIASAATLTLSADLDEQTFTVTGNTGPITAISARAAGSPLRLVFSSTPQINHNASTLILLGGANITIAAGDVLQFVSTGAGWRMTDYARASGLALVPGQQRTVGNTIVQNPTAVNATITGAHGLGGVPHDVILELECLAGSGGDIGYSEGDKVILNRSGIYVSGQSHGYSVSWDATNVTVISANNTLVALPNKSTRAMATVTGSKWKLNIYPIRWV